MVTKLVDENVVGKSVVGSDRAVEIEDTAATVSSIVNQHFYELVRRKLCSPAQGAVVKRQHVSFRSERIVRGAERRVAIDTG